MADTRWRTTAVLEFTKTLERLEPAVEDPADWAPLVEFVAVAEFERIGTFLEVQNWQQYTEMLTQWARATDSFETTVRRVSEVDGLVYFEIEERHSRRGDVHAVNSMTVFGFDEAGKICHLDVYLQQPR
jgi:hypothetical protein